MTTELQADTKDPGLITQDRGLGVAAVEARLNSDAWAKITSLEKFMESHPESFRELPIRNLFTPGLYIREIFMPAGTWLTSRIHLFEHPFVVSLGVVSVWDDDSGVVTIRAPYTGITKPGTRRVLFIHEDTIWTTFHLNPDGETNPDKLVERATYDHVAAQNASLKISGGN